MYFRTSSSAIFKYAAGCLWPAWKVCSTPTKKQKLPVVSSIGAYDEDPLWHKYFMGVALLSEKRSKDENRQVGACIVNDEPRVLGIGYNGMPLKCHDSLIWKKGGFHQQDLKDQKKYKHHYVCHAEMNAIVNMDPKSVKGSTIYVTLFPCNECAKLIIKSGIKRLVYLSDDKADDSPFLNSRNMLNKTEELEIVSYDEIAKKSKNDEMKKMWEKVSFGVQNSASSNKIKEIPWKHYFMALAVWSAQCRSETDCPEKEGVCIVNEDKRIVGLGYVQNIEADEVDDKNHSVMHAPVNAIVNQSPGSLKGCTLYTVRYPCYECAKVIVQSGIKKVIHLNNEECQFEMLKNYPDIEKKRLAAKRMLAMAHIKTENYVEKKSATATLPLDFNATVKS